MTDILRDERRECGEEGHRHYREEYEKFFGDPDTCRLYHSEPVDYSGYYEERDAHKEILHRYRRADEQYFFDKSLCFETGLAHGEGEAFFVEVYEGEYHARRLRYHSRESGSRGVEVKYRHEYEIEDDIDKAGYRYEN